MPFICHKCVHISRTLDISKFSFYTYAGIKIHFVYGRIWKCDYLMKESIITATLLGASYVKPMQNQMPRAMLEGSINFI
jgi:hypothetical protein